MKMSASEDRGLLIFDDEEGIILEIPMLGTGTAMRFYITDEVAQDMINIIQNKLNARL